MNSLVSVLAVIAGLGIIGFLIWKYVLSNPSLPVKVATAVGNTAADVIAPEGTQLSNSMADLFNATANLYPQGSYQRQISQAMAQFESNPLVKIGNQISDFMSGIGSLISPWMSSVLQQQANTINQLNQQSQQSAYQVSSSGAYAPPGQLYTAPVLFPSSIQTSPIKAIAIQEAEGLGRF
jgi:uncharacterized sodium:solute symporter family permease YidK